MSLLRVKAKVLLQDEDSMESEGKYDLGNISKSKEWVWRTIAISAHDIYKLIEFNPNKTVIHMYEDDEKILVAETFEEVYKKWEEALDGDWDRDYSQENPKEEE